MVGCGVVTGGIIAAGGIAGHMIGHGIAKRVAPRTANPTAVRPWHPPETVYLRTMKNLQLTHIPAVVAFERQPQQVFRNTDLTSR